MRVSIYLRPDEHRALIKLAVQERRALRDQAVVTIRQELERLGFLAAHSNDHCEQRQENRAA